MNPIILALVVLTAIASPSGLLGILTAVGLIYCIKPEHVAPKFTRWSWYDWRV